MKMGSKKKVEKIATRGEIYQCPSCGYPDGFHVSFRLNQTGAKGEVFLICPGCHSRFRLGWMISMAGSN
jgi:hypothetical protein